MAKQNPTSVPMKSKNELGMLLASQLQLHINSTRELAQRRAKHLTRTIPSQLIVESIIRR